MYVAHVPCVASPTYVHTLSLFFYPRSIAAMVGPTGRVLACDRDQGRLKRLQATVDTVGAAGFVQAHHVRPWLDMPSQTTVMLQQCSSSCTCTCVVLMHRSQPMAHVSPTSHTRQIHAQVDFLSLDPNNPKYAGVQALLLDPSCSGSGTTASRGDALLAAHANNAHARAASQRVAQLARFQQAALRHALRFPGLRRLVYSTCSVHREENEDVVAAVLDEARAAGYVLRDALPGWHRRGLEVVEGSEALVRVDAEEDGAEGFFVALFVKE